MTTIAIKRVYDPPAPGDGMRILVDRLWPRGVRKDDAALDLWAKEIAPSPSLRTWFDHRPERFAEFKRRYRAEFDTNPARTDLLAQIRGKRKVTFLYGARDPAMNQAVVLAEILKGAPTRSGTPTARADRPARRQPASRARPRSRA
jgi:uncharacterized protein YeaO (DUF488 family)